jgi:hypothetical protein
LPPASKEAALVESLEKAIKELRGLPEPEQEVLADFIASIVAERKFDRLLESPASLRVLEKMAEAAMEEHRRGETMDVEDLCR